MKKPQPPPQFSARMDQAFIQAMEEFYRRPELAKVLADSQVDYPYWEKFSRRVAHFGVAPEQLWRLVKQQRRASAQRLAIHPAADFQFSFALTGLMQQTLHRFDMQMGGSLGSLTTFPEGIKHQLLLSSLMEEAIASSQLEGAATSRVVAKEMLRSERRPRNKSERMILNNYLTMQELVGGLGRQMTVDWLLDIHRQVVQETLDDPTDEGRLRTNDEVQVVDHVSGEVLYSPPAHERLMDLLQVVCAFANDTRNEPFIHPVIRGIILHFLIGYIHPFVDGNGRTARALFYWYLLRNGYWLVEYLSISKIILRAPVQYARAYLHTEQDENDLTYFILFGLRSLDLARNDLEHYLQRKLLERRRLYAVVKNEPVNERQADILSILLKEPERFLSIDDVRRRFNVSYQTARTDLLGLMDLGYIAFRKAGGKRMLFHGASDLEQRISAKRE